jgi:hypothetical protein
MNTMPRLLAITIALLLAASGCMAPSEQPSSGGTGSEIVGKADYPPGGAPKRLLAQTALGLPVVNGRVFAFPQLFIPDTAWATAGAAPRTVTDSGGNFTVTDAPGGWVVVEVNDGKGQGITGVVNVDRDSSVFPIGTLTVEKTGSITLSFHTTLPAGLRYYASVRGTRLVARGGQSDVSITLSDVPSGARTVNLTLYNPWYFTADFPVTVPSGSSTEVAVSRIQ